MACYEEIDDFYDLVNNDDDYEPELYLPDYLRQIEKVIDAEVERRLTEKVSDMDKLRKEQETYHEILLERSTMINELNKELNAAKRTVAEAEKKLKAEIEHKRTDAFKELTNGWHEVTTAYMLEEISVYVNCPICKDHGKFTRRIDGVDLNMYCPICSKSSERVSFNKYESKRLTWFNLNDLMIIIDKSGAVYPAVQENWTSSSKVNLNTCYRTQEEALAEAERRTAENRTKAEERLMRLIEEKGYSNLIGAKNEKPV